MSDHAKIRRKLIKRYPEQIKKALAVVKCEVCGRYFSLDNIDCHHHIIPIKDLIDACDRNEISIKEAREFAKNRENIIVVCKKCHKKIHEQEKQYNNV